MWRRPNYDDKGSRSILSHNLLRNALAREGPKLRNGALARGFLAIQSMWWRHNYDDKGSRSTLPYNLFREDLAREPPKLRNGTLARDSLAI